MELNDVLSNSGISLKSDNDSVVDILNRIEGEPEEIKKDGFMTAEELRPFLDEYKAYYLANKAHFSIPEILRNFRILKASMGISFKPQNVTVKRLYKAWDKEEEMKKNVVAYEKKNGPINSEVLREANTFNEKLESFADLLLEDAIETMGDGEENARLKIEKKKYALGVAKVLFEKVQKDKLVSLKMKKDSRDGANWMLTLIQKAKSGELSGDDIKLLSGK